MKKNIREICLVCIAVILVLIFIFFIFKAKNNIFEYNTFKNEDIYFYVDDIYNEFNGIMTLDSKDNITSLKIDNNVWDSIFEPIYYSNLSKVVFPTNMSMVRPLAGFKQNKLPFYTNVINNDGVVKIKNSNLDMNVSNVFFFNGFDLYFFVEDISLSFNDKKINLSPLSYVKCDYKNYVYVYDYKNKLMTKYDDIKTDVFALNDDYSINLGTDSLYVGDNSIILSHSIEKLAVVK